MNTVCKDLVNDILKIFNFVKNFFFENVFELDPYNFSRASHLYES